MSQEEVLLDTDTLSAIMRQNPLVIPKAQAYLAQPATQIKPVTK
jgi:tRNA(fMet)-specific endonuclease VapC